MASLKERISGTLGRMRERHGWLDHLIRMFQHYGTVNGNAQAGAVTYFGFLSFFPILALGLFVIGLVANVYPDIRGQMTTEISNLLPGVIGDGPSEISLDTIGSYSGLAGVLGLVGVLYAGLGWLSGLRKALEVMFATPPGETPNLLVGKLRDLGALVLIGAVLMVSVVLSGAVTGFSDLLLGWVGIDAGSLVPTVVLGVLARALAVAASMVLLLTMFKLLLVESHVPRRAMVSGALLGAVGFEVLKAGAGLLLGQTRGQPAFQAFGVALILLIWINYFSRLVMFAAAWSYTAPSAREQRREEAVRFPATALATGDAAGPAGARTEDAASGRVRAVAPDDVHRPWRKVAGAAAAAGAVAVIVRGARR